jgi:hypothetical protein
MSKSRRSTRKSGKGGRGLFRRVYSPIEHIIDAGRNISRATFKRTGRMVNNGIGLVGNVGKSVVTHANKTVRNVVSRKSRKQTRKSRKSRK